MAAIVKELEEKGLLKDSQGAKIVDLEEYNMPPKEFYLIFKLLSSPNKIFTRMELMDEIWGMDTEIDDRTIDSHIKKLRRKFENCNDFEIITVRGLGYKAKI